MLVEDIFCKNENNVNLQISLRRIHPYSTSALFFMLFSWSPTSKQKTYVYRIEVLSGHQDQQIDIDLRSELNNKILKRRTSSSLPQIHLTANRGI